MCIQINQMPPTVDMCKSLAFTLLCTYAYLNIHTTNHALYCTLLFLRVFVIKCPVNLKDRQQSSAPDSVNLAFKLVTMY